MTKKEFVNGFALLAEYYNFCDGDNEQLIKKSEIYYQMLQELSIEEWEKAVKITIKERVYQSMPKVAELLNAVYGTVEEQATNAFKIAISAMGEIGSYSSVRFEDEAIMTAIDSLGGWVAFGEIPVDNNPMAASKRKEFISVYQANRHKKFSRGYLRGLTELKNGVDSEHNSYMLINKNGDVHKAVRDEVAQITAEQKAFNALLSNPKIANTFEKFVLRINDDS